MDFAQSALDQSGQMIYLLKHRDELANKRFCVRIQIFFNGALDVSKAPGFHIDGANEGIPLLQPFLRH